MSEYQQQNPASSRVEDAAGSRTDEESMQSVGTSLAMGVDHDATRTGTISTTFANAISAPRTHTAYPQEYGPERLTSGSRQAGGSSRALHTGNSFHSVMDPQHLMVNTNAACAEVGDLSGYDDAVLVDPISMRARANANLHARSFETPAVPVYDDVANLYSPLRHRFEGLELPESSPVDSASVSSSEVSHPATLTPQQIFYGLWNGQYQWPQGGYWQYHTPQMYPVPYYGTNPYALTPDEGTSAQSMTQLPMLGHEALPGVVHHRDPQSRESSVYNPVGPSSSVWQSTDTGHSSAESSGVTTASDSLNAQLSFNPPIETPSQALPEITGPSAPRQVPPRPSTPESSRPATAFILSTDHGPAMRMYDPNFANMRPQVSQMEGGLHEPTPVPASAGTSGLNSGRMKVGDKGKGKSILREDNDQPPHLSPDDEINPSPDRKKRERNIFAQSAELAELFPLQGEGEASLTRVRRKGVSRIRRASPTRPAYVDCPFCKYRISNHIGSVRRHVEVCPSPQVQAIRDYQGGPNRSGANPPVKITCPACRGRKRKFGTLSRWGDHLSHVHGEWITYECDIPGCGEKFVSEWDCNEHKRREHRN